MNSTFDQDRQTIEKMQQLLTAQQTAFINEGFVSAQTRIDRIDRTIALILENTEALEKAINADFGSRSYHQTAMSDFFGTVAGLQHARKHVVSWMKPKRHSVMFPLNILGAKARVEYQPKGTVGNITTWNFPVHVALAPLAGIFAAGNRAMLKLTEVTPTTSELLKELIGKYFSPEECVGITGGPAVGQAFAELPLDHIIFTGSTSIAQYILQGAAKNLTPVTLELGGKSPVIIGSSADIKEAAARIMAGKALNSGQVCLSPDYIFVPQEYKKAFLEHCIQQFSTFFPTMRDNPDYTSVINQRHYERLQGLLSDAKDKCSSIIEINPANEDFSKQETTHKIPLTLLVDPADDAQVMQEELFGPLVCIKTYNNIDDCIQFINQRPRPLAIYYFGQDAQEERKVLDKTISGGAVINDVMAHVICEDLPFGGVGDSGMGNYHGFYGFATFSHPKAVFKQSKINLMRLGGMLPPYGKKTEKRINMMLKK